MASELLWPVPKVRVDIGKMDSGSTVSKTDRREMNRVLAIWLHVIKAAPFEEKATRFDVHL